MKTQHTIIIIILIIIAFLIGLFFNKIFLTGQVIQETNQIPDKTLTKAICNQDNECVDMKISCKNNQVIKIELVSKIITFSENQINTRELENLCD